MWKWLIKHKEEPVAEKKATSDIECDEKKIELTASHDLQSIKKTAREQLENIEKMLEVERENYRKKEKEKEDEKIKLSIHLELVELELSNNMQLHQDSINSLRKKWNDELQRVERKIEEEDKEWGQKIRAIITEIDETKVNLQTRENEKKAEDEKEIISSTQELREIESQLLAFEKKAQQEIGEFVTRLKGREEEIVALKAQISLRVNQSRQEEEKFHREKKELEGNYNNQLNGVEKNLSEMRANFQKIYNDKKEGLLAFSSALKQRQIIYEQELNAKKILLKDLKEKLVAQMSEMERESLSEKEKYEKLLKEREDAFNKLKIDMMLQETQESSAREKRFNEFKEAKSLAEKQLKELHQKYEQEKSEWENMIRVADQDIEDIKIQAQIKIREKNAEIEKYKTNIENEKKRISLRCTDLEKEVLNQKIEYQSELSGKYEEMEKFKNDWQSNQEQKNLQHKHQIEILSEEKKLIEDKYQKFQEDFSKIKTEYSSLLSQKKSQVEAAKNSVEAELLESTRSFENAKKKLFVEVEPYKEKLKVAESKKARLEMDFKQKMAEKERDYLSLKQRFAHQENMLESRYHQSVDKLSAEIDSIKADIDEIDSQKISLEKEHSKNMKELENVHQSLMQKMEDEKKNHSLALESFNVKLKEEKGSIEAKIEELNSVVISEQKRFDETVSAKNDENNQLEKVLLEKTAVLQKNLDATRFELEGKKKIAIESLERTKVGFNFFKEKCESEISESERHIQAISKKVNDLISANKYEIEEKESIISAELELVRKKLEESSKKLDETRKKHADILIEFDNKITFLNASRETNIHKYEKEIKILELENENEKKLINEEIEKIENESEEMKSRHAELLAEKKREIEKLKSDHLRFEQEYKARLNHMESEFNKVKELLISKITSNEMELAQLEEKHPGMVATRQQQIQELNAKLKEQEDNYTKNRDSYFQSHEQFVKRIEKRKENLENQMKAIKIKQEQELSEVEEKLKVGQQNLKVLEDEMKTKFENSSQNYAAEKHSLDRKRDELEHKLKALVGTNRDEVRILDRQLYVLKTQMALREKSWHEEEKKQNENYENERKVLAEELTMLQNNFLEVQNAGKTALCSKTSELNAFINKSQASLEQTKNELKNKETTWTDTNKRLEEQISTLQKTIREQGDYWSNLKSQKEEEMKELGNKITTWESYVTDEEQRITKEHLAEKEKIEREMEKLSSEMEKLKKETGETISGKIKTQRELEAKYDDEKNRLESEWVLQEAKLLKERETLLAEVNLWESKLKESENSSAKIIGEIEKEIESRKLKVALSKSEFETARLRHEKKSKNLLKKLEKDLTELLRKYNDYLSESKNKIYMEEEKITTLSKRLELRNERLQNETKKRGEELQKYIDELKGVLEETIDKNKSQHKLSSQAIENLRKELADAGASYMKDSPEISAQLKLYEDKNTELISMVREISELENSIMSEKDRFTKLLELKMNQLDVLEAGMQMTTKEIMAESIRRREMRENLKKFADDFMGKMVSYGQTPKEVRPMLLKRAVELCEQGSYSESLEILREFTRNNPSSAEAQQYMSLCFYNTDKLDDALMAIKKAISIEPKNENLISFEKELTNKINNKSGGKNGR